MSAGKAFENTDLVAFLKKRIRELRRSKTQAEIASQAGFKSVNMLAMIKAGRSRLPIDRVPALAVALDVDPARLLLLALEQDVGNTTARTIREIMGGTIVSRNEGPWLQVIREASDNTDPPLTKRSRTGIMSLLRKAAPDGSWPQPILLSEHETFIIDVVRVALNGAEPVLTLDLAQRLRRMFDKQAEARQW